jgi:predicted MPP superfamily phosphohydrolase
MTILFLITAAILLGFTLFLYQQLRHRPGPLESSSAARWARRVQIALTVLLLFLTCISVWSFLIEPNRLVIRHESISINNWPKELNDLKIAVIADIHAGSWCIDNEKLRQIVERTNQLQPDVIVVLGDYMSENGWTSDRVGPEVFAPVLKDFRAPLGVYSVLGNHDWWWKGERVRGGLEANGIKVLDNEVTEVKTRGTSLWLAGLGDLWTRPQQIEATIVKVPEGQPLIALTHNPDIFPRIPKRVPLLLAAHTHGGQVRLPIIGTAIVPSNYGDRYVRGHVVENDHHLFVTSGIGTSILPLRFGVPPEIVLLTIKSQ